MAGGGDRRDPRTGPASRAELPSIAVLPLFSFRHGTINREFGAGIAFSITSALMTFSNINVISVSSTLSYAQSSFDTRAIAKQLGARYVVFGQVAQADQTLTFKIGLLDAETGRESSFDPLDVHISALHNADGLIVGRIINTIMPEMRNAEIEKTLALAQPGLSASEVLLEAIPSMHRSSRASLDHAEQLLRGVLATDPSSAQTYAWLARLYWLRVSQGWVKDRREACLEALRLARQALELDPRNAVALMTAGHFHSYLLKETDRGLEMMRRAIEIAPSEPYAWLMLATTLAYLGEAAEARRHAEHALSLSPLDAHISYFHTFLGLCHYVDGNYAQAVRYCRKSLAESPLYSTTWRLLAVSLVGLGETAEARAAAKKMLELEPNYPSIAEDSTPFLDAAVRERYLTHLATAGLRQRV